MKIPYSTAKAFIAGEKDAQEEVYRSTRKLLYFVIRSIVNEEEDAKDVYQNVFVKAIANAATLQKPEALQAYLLSLAKNESLNYLRAKHQEDPSDQIDSLYGEEETRYPYLESYYPFLSPKENAVVLLKIEGEMSFRDIAALSGLNRQSLNNLYRSALKKIKRFYQEEKRHEHQENH